MCKSFVKLFTQHVQEIYLKHKIIISNHYYMKILLLLVVLLGLTFGQKHNVTQVTSRNFLAQLKNSEFSLVYVYSSSCGYCQQFTPLYEKLSTQEFFREKQVRFLKVDESLFKHETEKLGIFSYPTVLLFWKDFSEHPIFFRQQRTQPNLKAFIQKSTRINQNNIPDAKSASPYQRIEQKLVLYYGAKSSPLYKKMGLVSNRDKFFSWTLVPIGEKETEKLVIGNKQITDPNVSVEEIQTTIKKVFARVLSLGEQPWVRIFLNKQLAIIHVNPNKNTKYSQLLTTMAKTYYDLVFMELGSDHPEYKAALKTFTIHDEENIIAVDRRSQATFVATAPHTKESLTDFIEKVKKYEWPVYRKTEKSTKQEKLTRQNYKEKMSTNQDVVLFLYRRQQKISQNLIGLFNHLRTKLQDNQNLLFLRCDVSSNQIQQYLQFSVQKTPKLVFFRNRMKDKPIHFYGGKISEQSVVEFIMENTTFDWKDEWGEL